MGRVAAGQRAWPVPTLVEDRLGRIRQHPTPSGPGGAVPHRDGVAVDRRAGGLHQSADGVEREPADGQNPSVDGGVRGDRPSDGFQPPRRGPAPRLSRDRRRPRPGQDHDRHPLRPPLPPPRRPPARLRGSDSPRGNPHPDLFSEAIWTPGQPPGADGAPTGLVGASSARFRRCLRRPPRGARSRSHST